MAYSVSSSSSLNCLGVNTLSGGNGSSLKILKCLSKVTKQSAFDMAKSENLRFAAAIIVGVFGVMFQW